MMLTQQQGKDIVKYARAVIVGQFKGVKAKVPMSLLPLVEEKRGVFVTLHRGHDLRGCIGFPEPSHRLLVAVEHSALSAAFEDPRFLPIHEDEMYSICLEVSVLTKPEIVEVKEPKEYVKRIRIGRDGLIAERGLNRGLLLPQVPLEQRWSVDDYLMHTCAKAGLMPDEWTKKGFRLYRFQAQIFSEEEPLGEVAERKI